jgi:hypothetical protein
MQTLNNDEQIIINNPYIVNKTKILIEFDHYNYQKFLQMIENDQKVRDRSYKLWQETHQISKPRKRKDPLKFKLL